MNLNWFACLAEAHRIIEDWRLDYNERRPHSSLNYQTPEHFAANRPFHCVWEAARLMSFCQTHLCLTLKGCSEFTLSLLLLEPNRIWVFAMQWPIKAKPVARWPNKESDVQQKEGDQ